MGLTNVSKRDSHLARKLGKRGRGIVYAGAAGENRRGDKSEGKSARPRERWHSIPNPLKTQGVKKGGRGQWKIQKAG